MAGSAGAHLVGADQLRRTLGQALDELRRLEGAGDAAGAVVAAKAEANAPRRTGRLAATVRYVVTAQGFAVEAGGGPVDYAGIVHARQPFIADAFATTADDVVDTYLEDAERALARVQGA